MQNVKMHKLSSAKASFVAHELIYGKIIRQHHLISMFNCNQSFKTCTSYQQSCDNDDKEENVDQITCLTVETI